MDNTEMSNNRQHSASDDWLMNERRRHMETDLPPGDHDKPYTPVQIPLKPAVIMPLLRALAKVVKGELGGPQDGENQ